jgi:hypothetical protein
MGIFQVEDIGPNQYDGLLLDLPLDVELSFCLKLDPDLALIIEGAIEYTIIQIDFEHSS